MKQWKIIIVFSVLLALLIGTLVATSILKNNKDTTSNVSPTPAIDPVIAIEEKDVSKITIENSNGKLEIVPGKGKDASGSETSTWKLSYPENIVFSEASVSSKISLYTQITAEKLVAGKDANLSEFGLDKPLATVSVYLKSGVTKKILYGNETASIGANYVMLEGSGRICTTGSSNVSAAKASVLDFLDTNVLNSITVADTMNLTFKRAKDNLLFTAKSNNNASADGQTPATWQIITPIKIEANAEGYSVLLDQLTKITADSFIENAPKDFAKYGLDKPAYEFAIASKDKTIKCILGGNAGNGSLYAYSDYVKAVFIINSGSLTLIDKPFVEMINSFVHMASIWEVKAIDINIDAQNIRCDIVDSQDKDTKSDFKVNGKDANVMSSSEDSYFRGFYQSIISIFIKGIDVEAKPEYIPTISISYTMIDVKKNIKLDFVKRDELTYFVFKDKIYQGYYVNKDDFYSEKTGDEGILPAYKILLDAMQKQVGGIYK